MTGRENCALQVPPIVPNKAVGNLSNALYGTTGGTCSARFFRPVMIIQKTKELKMQQLFLIKEDKNFVNTSAIVGGGVAGCKESHFHINCII